MAKAAHTLAIPTFGEMGKRHPEYRCPGKSDPKDWPTEVPSNADGPIDVSALREFVEYFVDKGHPVLIVLTLGSTYRGAHDDVRMVIDKLGTLLRRRSLQVDGNTEKRNNYWTHIDDALGATYLPFVKRARQEGLLASGSSATPDFDSHLEKVSSIVTSGHKYPGRLLGRAGST